MTRQIDLSYSTRLINHGPVVLVSSLSEDERLNVSTVAWCMPISKNPPRVILEIGASHYIRDCIEATGDFALNILSEEYVDDLVYCGSVSGRDTDKLENCNLSEKPSREISSPQVAESIGVLECRQIHPELAEKYNLIAGEVISADADPELFAEHWQFTGEASRTVHHLGGRKFCVPERDIISPS